MPSRTPKQQHYMGMLAHNPAMARAKGIPMDVAMEFAHKPKGGYRKRKTRTRRKR